MKKILALTLAVLLLLACVGCTTKEAKPTEPTTEPTTKATEPTTESTEPTDPSVNSDRTALYIQLCIYEEDDSFVSITAFDDDAGQAYVEYAAVDEKKIGYLELSALDALAEAIEGSALLGLNEQSVYDESSIASASMFVSYDDESMLMADFTGTIPQEFRDGYAEVEACVRELMKDVEVYVPAPMIDSDVDPDMAAQMEAILNASGAEPLDMFYISNVYLDESFNALMGLSKSEGIVSGLSCSYNMSAVAFSCMIAKAENEANVSAIADDFAANIDWNRWICVSATDAMIATKGDLVLCLVTTGDLYTQITTGVEANGWTVVKTLTN